MIDGLLIESQPRKRLDTRRRVQAFLVILIGLATFVAPLISTDPPVLGQTKWSPLGILLHGLTGVLPAPERAPWWRWNVVDVFLFYLFLLFVYLTLLIAVFAVVAFPSDRLLRFAAWLGVAAEVPKIIRVRWDQSLVAFFYGKAHMFEIPQRFYVHLLFIL
jgi:hypothetical protein